MKSKFELFFFFFLGGGGGGGGGRCGLEPGCMDLSPLNSESLDLPLYI